MNRRFRFLPVLLPLLLPSCGQLSRLIAPKDDEKPTASGAAIPAQLRAGANQGTPVAAGGNVSIDPSMLTPSNDIVWTDPDHPETGIPELATMMAVPKKGNWEDDEAVARQRAVREGKPLLILFLDSARNPACKELSDELLVRKDFEDWSRQNVVRLRVDASPEVKDLNLSMEQTDAKKEKLKNELDDMKKRYKVLGFPAILLVAPNGDVIGRYNGYKRGSADYTFGLLKQGAGLAAKSSNEWRGEMKKKGYREWQDRDEKHKVFAKLVSYSKGTVVLVEPDGRRSQTQETKLSIPDQEWIRQQKALRGIE